MTRFYAHQLFDGRRWRQDAIIHCDDEGMITKVEDSANPLWPRQTDADASVDPNPDQSAIPIALPGFVNSHSHGFQALFAGLAEQRLHPDDDFWSWRKQMYHCAGTLKPDDIEAVYTYLYQQMLAAGYTHVCEFHYLHHDLTGEPYQPLGRLADAIRRAATTAGIGLTLLPVWYRYSQFGRKPTNDGQKRFAMDDATWRDYLQAVAETPDSPLYKLGVAAHSLRAVAIEDIPLLYEPLSARPGPLPLHIHIAEQTKEVADCVAEYGKRPVELFMAKVEATGKPGQVWSLVHATHLTAAEQQQIIAADAVAVLCPTTEANLGDGAFAYQEFLTGGHGKKSGRIAIGSDSQVCLEPFAELQLMEYTARLAARRRSVLATADQPSPATRLVAEVSASAAATSGLPLGLIEPGYRCDLIGYDPSPLCGQGQAVVDDMMIRRPYTRPDQVIVAGKRVAGGAGPDDELNCPFRKAFAALRKGLAEA